MPYIIQEEYCPHCKSIQRIKFGFRITCLNCMNRIEEDEEHESDTE
ncbi:hypothetical protein TSARBOMBA_166 [Bacillus phage TsarBomba]|uniref:Uncharacterized protein n=1 Tax=Bacillus phage TsarBomba TaxID=1690456 RepID=A0A0K2D0B8_9CAUD|nr:hypothetical protein TSARBOMBA_166 [Bacillus phage TsarBomba]ALA13200.1 hypothetical protein TSARBOMBA_166 [Bacillus phage TsarBomba]